MSKGTGYIMLDKYLAQEFKSIRREFSIIEAMFSYTLDKDNGKGCSISGYSKLWGWSRWRVRKFIETIHSTTGHYPDRRQTHSRHPIHFIDKCLWVNPDSIPTVSRQYPDTTTNPNPNPNKKLPSEIYDFVEKYISFICKQNPKIKKSDVEKSADTIDKLIRIDKHQLVYIRKVLNWAVKDDFWSDKVLSLIPLRSKSRNTFSKFQNIVNSFEKENGNHPLNGFDKEEWEQPPSEEQLEKINQDFLS